MGETGQWVRRKDLNEVLLDVVDRVSVPSMYQLRDALSSTTQERHVRETYHVFNAVDGGESQVNGTRMLKVESTANPTLEIPCHCIVHIWQFHTQQTNHSKLSIDRIQGGQWHTYIQTDGKKGTWMQCLYSVRHHKVASLLSP